MAIVINGSGTVTGLAVGGLPDGTVDSGTIATGTIVDADVANLAASKLTGALPAISGASLTGITTGKILQVLQSVKTDEWSSSTQSFVDVTGLSISITPSSTTSKILVMLSSNFSTISTGWVKAQLTNASNTELAVVHSRAESGMVVVPFTHIYLDSPASTSAQTYKMRFSGEAGTNYVNRMQATNYEIDVSTITVMEIGA